MENNFNFEAGGDLEDWPKNVPGKQTQVAVFGTQHITRGKVCEIMWTGIFPDLEKAMYWGAKKEVEAVRKHGFMMASRVIWQHDLTPEAAVATVYKRMEPQMDRVMKTVKKGGDPDKALREGPAGPMKPIDYSNRGMYMWRLRSPMTRIFPRELEQSRGVPPRTGPTRPGSVRNFEMVFLFAG